jgi:hypothetical protein
LLGFVLLGASCAPTTKMVTSWSAPDYQPGSVKKILVAGVARDASIRRVYEDRFVKKLKGLGYEAVASYLWVPDLSAVDKEAIKARVVQEGVTHVLATRLVDQKTVETYVPPTTVATPVAPYYPTWYGSYYSYWSTGWSYSTSPGYVTQETVVSLETNLYNAGDEALIWTGLTETWIWESPSDNIEPVIQKTMTELRSKKIL